jgi:nitrogen fixation protein FixH
MTLLIGIFGGMLLAALVYGLGRLAGLSNFWAAVAAATLPTFIYLAYAAATRPGLDVITLHVIAFPTVAILLSQLYGAKADHGRTLHWAPKLMVLFFLAISVIFGGFVYIAVQGLPPGLARLLLPDTGGKNVHTGFAGVVEHAQGAAKAIGQHLAMDHRLAQLGWQVEVSGLAGLRAGQPGTLSVRVSGADGQAVDGMRVTVRLNRPGQQQGIELVADGGTGGHHAGIPPLEAGTWVARIRLVRGTDEVVLEHGLEVR